MANSKIRKSMRITVIQPVVLMSIISFVLMLAILSYVVSLSISSIKAASTNYGIKGLWRGLATPDDGQQQFSISIKINPLPGGTLPNSFSGDLFVNKQKGTIEGYTNGTTITFIGSLVKCHYEGIITADRKIIQGLWYCPDGRTRNFSLYQTPPQL